MKRRVSIIMIVCMLINMMSLQSFAYEEKVKSNTKADIETKILEKERPVKKINLRINGKKTAHSILAEKERYSQLDEEEKNIVNEFFGLEEFVMDRLENMGYSLRESVNIGVDISDYKFKFEKIIKSEFNRVKSKRYETVVNEVYAKNDKAEKINIVPIKSETTVANEVYVSLKNSSKKTTVAEEVYLNENSTEIILLDDDINMMLDYVGKGHEFKNVAKAWEVSRLFDEKLDDFINKDIEKGKLASEKKIYSMWSIEQLADKHYLDMEFLNRYKKTNEESWEEKYIQLKEYKKPKKRSEKDVEQDLTIRSMSVTEQNQSAPYNPYFNSKRVHENSNGDSVSLNNGNLKYHTNILNIPGKNGMDLNLDISYDSSNSKLAKYNYVENLISGSYPYTVQGHVEAYTFDEVNGWLSYPVTELNINQTEINESDWFFQASKIAEGWENKTYYQKNFQGSLDLLVEYKVSLSRDNTQALDVQDSIVDIESSKIDNYIGCGWQFDIPNIITIDRFSQESPVALKMSNGNIYMIDKNAIESGNPYESSGLIGYELNDIKLIKNIGEFSNGEETSYYTLKHKSGHKYFFSEKGDLIGENDRYGNAIKYYYVISGQTSSLYKIEDSLGRIVDISYSQLGDDKIITVNPPNQKNIKITLEKIPDSQMHILKKIKKPLVNEIIFDYDIQVAKFSFTDKNNKIANNKYANLRRVKYPAGGESSYIYETFDKKLGYVGAYESFRVTERKDSENALDFNKEIYSYTRNDIDFQEKFSKFKDNGYEYETSIEYSNGSKNRYVFNGLELQIFSELKNQNGNVINNSTYSYDRYKMKNREIENRYNGIDFSSYEYNWEYDGYGDLLRYIDPMNVETKYTYDSYYHQISSVQKQIDENRHSKIEFAINTNNGNVESISKHYTQDGVQKSLNTYLVYDEYGNIISKKEEKDNNEFKQTDYEYSQVYNGGYMTKVKSYVKDYQNNTEIMEDNYTYDFNTGNLLSEERDNKRTSYEYDDFGRMIKEIYDDNSYRSVLYDDINNSIVLTLENGYKIKQIYDGLGRVIEKKELIDSQMVTTKKQEYNNMGQIAWFEDAKSNKTEYKYDDLGRIIKTINPDYTYSEIRYNDDENKITKLNEESAEVSYYYDKNGNLTKQELKNGLDFESIKYGYDYIGNNIYKIDRNGNIFEMQYDEVGRLIKTINEIGESIIYEHSNNGTSFRRIQMEYDMEGNLGKQIITTKEYDDLGRLIKSTDPSGSTEIYKYDLSGNLKYKKDRSGQEGTYAYDKRNRLISRVSKNSEGYEEISTNYDYSMLYESNKVTITHNGNIIEYEYYPNGRVKSEKDILENAITAYEYDRNGNLSKIVDPYDMIIDYSYDNRDRLDTLKIDSQYVFDYEYYDDGMMKSLQYPVQGMKSNFVYDDANRLLDLNNNYNAMIDSYEYSYDPNGNITSIDENASIFNYSYDSLNRLRTLENTLEQKTTSYDYDARGNRIKMQGYINSIYASGESLKTLKYNSLNQLVEFVDGKTQSTTKYEYNYKGLRVKKEGISTIGYYYDIFDRCIAETDNNGDVKAQIVWGHKPLVRKANSQYYYYIYNGHGDVVKMLDQNGQVVNNYKYDIWGNIIDKEENIENPIKYAGEYYDDESGMYYLRSRYYNPKTGRFISRDSYEGAITNPASLNLYIYCYNNPLKYIDPSGNRPEEDFYAENITYVRVTRQGQTFYVPYSPEKLAQAQKVGRVGATLIAGDIYDVELVLIGYDFEEQRWATKGERIAYLVVAAAPGSSKLLKETGEEVLEFAVKGTGELAEQVWKRGDDLVDGMKLYTDDALDAAEDFLGQGYKDLGNGRYMSADGTKVVRMGDSDILGKHGGGSHMNFETLVPNPAKPGKMKVDTNLHIYLIGE